MILDNIYRYMDNGVKDITLYDDALSYIRNLGGVNVELAHGLRARIEKGMRDNRGTSFMGDLFRVYKLTLCYTAPECFEDYMVYVEIDRPYEKQFYMPRRRYLRPLIQAYQDVADGKLKLLTVSLVKRGGKALTLDTPIATPNGFVPMGKIRVGDSVIGRDGKPTKVVGVYPQGKVPVYKVKFSDGAEIRTCGNHLWEVKFHDETIHWGSGSCYCTKIVTTEELFNSKLKSDTHRLYSVRYCEPVQFRKRELMLHPYIMGALIGDGCLRDATPMFTSFDDEIVEHMRDVLPETDDMHCQDAKRGRYLISAKGGVKNGGTVRSVTASALEYYGVNRKGSADKFVPTEYLYSDVEDRLELLRGLLDTDGYADNHRIEFSTVSKQLAEQVQFLCRSLGGYSTIRSRMGKYRGKDGSVIETRTNYRVSLQFPHGVNPFHLKRKSEKYSPKREALYHYIESVELCGEDYAQCICVDNEDHLYLASKYFVPTHNSQSGINFVNWISGKHPDRSTLMEGTGDDLVKSFYLGCLEYLQQPNEYLFYDVFPKSKLVQQNADTKIINLVEKSRFPTIMCRSIDARQVGLSEATNVLYLDDCVEGREEAKNRDLMDKKWEIISGDVMGRAIEGTPIIATGTRYSLYDPIGRLQEEAERQGWKWRAIELPALNENDESNYEYYNPKIGQMVFTTAFFKEQRDMLTAEQWESEFQQQPFEAKGLLFPDNSLNRFFELPTEEPDSVIAVCDTAESGSDSTSMGIFYLYGNDVFLADVVFDNSVPEVTKPQCAKKIIEHNVSVALFESNNAGTYFARDVEELVSKAGHRVSIRTKRTVSNKQTRIEFASDGITKNFYFLDKSKYERNSQYGAFMKELTTYTRSGKVPHDDAPDMLSLAENYLRTVVGAKAEVMIRPW